MTQTLNRLSRFQRLRCFMAFVLAAFLVPGLAAAQDQADTTAPEVSVPLEVTATAPVTAPNWMVAAANPLAAEAGAEMLRQGGNAIDAMIATQLVLGLVEPQSSGLGGGAFLVYFDAEAGKVTTIDGRETAPMAATPTLFQTDDGERMGFFDAVIGGRSVGVPGTPMLLADTHEKWGELDWATLFEPAIKLADEGFAVSPRLAGLIANEGERLKSDPVAAAYFFDDNGAPLGIGATLKNPDYARTLRILADSGVREFYRGGIAEKIVEKVQGYEANPGVMELSDLATYRTREREPVCVDYRGVEVCGMGPPSSGALTVGQILGLLSHFDLAALGPQALESWRLIGDASRLAFADRGRYMADIDFVPMPLEGLVDPDYLAERAQLLERGSALDEVAPGSPEFSHASLWADDVSLELPSTSHVSIVDADGNAVSLTTTIENGFGSRLMVEGFLLNNELTDFSFASHADGVPIANAVAPGKRPRSSMSPTIVVREGKPEIVVGSPGGSRIIGYVATALIAMLDWDMDPQEAAALPHLVNRFGTYDLEADTSAEDFSMPLQGLGFEVNVRDLNSGLHIIAVSEDGLTGGADPRREGVALGE